MKGIERGTCSRRVERRVERIKDQIEYGNFQDVIDEWRNKGGDDVRGGGGRGRRGTETGKS